MTRRFIGQQMMIGIQGVSLTRGEEDFIVRNNISGIILFKRNCENPQQIAALVRRLQSLRNRMIDRAPLFVGIDMEGGRVHRLQAPFTIWPPVGNLGEIDSASLAFRFAYAQGTELKAVGINLNFSPCLDVLTNPENRVIGDRSLGSDPEKVSKLGSAMVRGFIKSGIISCGKHFPGHGNTFLDSHEALPVENKTVEELEACELEPFRRCFRAKLPMVMSSHIQFPKIDPVWPGTLSENILTQLLREKARFRGITVTDDLGMKALTLHHSTGQIAIRALKAGANLLLYCNEPDAPGEAIEAIEKAVAEKQLNPQVLAENAKRIGELKEEYLSDSEPMADDDLRYVVGNAEHQRLADAIRSRNVPEDLLTQPA